MKMQLECVINLTNGSHRTAPCLPNRDSQLRIAAVRKREWRNLSVNGRLLWKINVELLKSNSWSQSPSATSLLFWWLCVSDSCDQYPRHQQPPGWLCNAMHNSVSCFVHGHSMIFLHIPTTPDHDSQETWYHATPNSEFVDFDQIELRIFNRPYFILPDIELLRNQVLRFRLSGFKRLCV